MNRIYALTDLRNRANLNGIRWLRLGGQTYDVVEYLEAGNDGSLLIDAAARNDVQEAAQLLDGYNISLHGDTSTDLDNLTHIAQHAYDEPMSSIAPGDGSNQPPAGYGQRNGSDDQPPILQLREFAIKNRETILNVAIGAIVVIVVYLLSNGSSSK
ncbi:uncharacterized protein LOC113306878 [Papaver somniferum]|nr:uncharacterized protein LOC113306878 [Papaver somniferum]